MVSLQQDKAKPPRSCVIWADESGLPVCPSIPGKHMNHTKKMSVGGRAVKQQYGQRNAPRCRCGGRAGPAPCPPARSG